MTDDEIASFLRTALPDQTAVLSGASLRWLVTASSTPEFLADPAGAALAMAPTTGARADVIAIGKLIAMALAFLRHVTTYVKNRDARALALELYPDFIANALPPHVALVLPDDVRKHLFKLYLEEQKLLAAPEP